MSRDPHPQVGEVWYRVDGLPVDEYADAGVELGWEEWKVAKVTPRGAWFACVTWPYKTREKLRFAQAVGARWLQRTKPAALKALVARKRRHLAILNHQQVFAEQTLAAATAALQDPPAEGANLDVISMLGGMVGYEADEAELQSWPAAQLNAFEDWAARAHLRASDNDITVPPRPAWLPEPWQGEDQGGIWGRSGTVLKGLAQQVIA